MKQKILDKLNELIVEEKGTPVTMNDIWPDTNLDSLGTVITLAILESEYPIFKHLENDADALATIDFPNLTIRELVKQCVLSITNTSTEPPSEKT